MSGLFAQIRAIVASMLSSIRFHWVRCRATGEMLLQKAAGSIDGLLAPSAAPVIESQAYALPELASNPSPHVAPDRVVDLIKKAATELAGGIENDETLNAIPDRILQWLSALDRLMLCRLVVATPEQIRAHLDGKGGMQKVIACDRAAIEMYVEARRRRARRDEDFEREMTEDCAPAWA